MYKQREEMKISSRRHYSQTFTGLTRTVICVDQAGPDAVVLSSEFDLQNRLLRQVRFEHLKGLLGDAAFARELREYRIREHDIIKVCPQL